MFNYAARTDDEPPTRKKKNRKNSTDSEGATIMRGSASADDLQMLEIREDRKARGGSDVKQPILLISSDGDVANGDGHHKGKPKKPPKSPRGARSTTHPSDQAQSEAKVNNGATQMQPPPKGDPSRKTRGSGRSPSTPAAFGSLGRGSAIDPLYLLRQELASIEDKSERAARLKELHDLLEEEAAALRNNIRSSHGDNVDSHPNGHRLHHQRNKSGGDSSSSGWFNWTTKKRRGSDATEVAAAASARPKHHTLRERGEKTPRTPVGDSKSDSENDHSIIDLKHWNAKVKADLGELKEHVKAVAHSHSLHGSDDEDFDAATDTDIKGRAGKALDYKCDLRMFGMTKEDYWSPHSKPIVLEIAEGCLIYCPIRLKGRGVLTHSHHAGERVAYPTGARVMFGRREGYTFALPLTQSESSKQTKPLDWAADTIEQRQWWLQELSKCVAEPEHSRTVKGFLWLHTQVKKGTWKRYFCVSDGSQFEWFRAKDAQTIPLPTIDRLTRDKSAKPSKGLRMKGSSHSAFIKKMDANMRFSIYVHASPNDPVDKDTMQNSSDGKRFKRIGIFLAQAKEEVNQLRVAIEVARQSKASETLERGEATGYTGQDDSIPLTSVILDSEVANSSQSGVLFSSHLMETRKTTRFRNVLREFVERADKETGRTAFGNWRPEKASVGDGHVRVISLDGGGIKGIIQAVILDRLVKIFPDLLQRCDMFAGISVGSMAACALATGRSPKFLEELMRLSAPYLFDRKVRWAPVRTCKFSPINLMILGSELTKNLTYHDVSKYLLIPSFLLDNEMDNEERSWEAQCFHNIPQKDRSEMERLNDTGIDPDDDSSSSSFSSSDFESDASESEEEAEESEAGSEVADGGEASRTRARSGSEIMFKRLQVGAEAGMRRADIIPTSERLPRKSSKQDKDSFSRVKSSDEASQASKRIIPPIAVQAVQAAGRVSSPGTPNRTPRFNIGDDEEEVIYTASKAYFPPELLHTLLWDTVMASAAAPTFFPSYKKQIDAAVMTNDPALTATCALMSETAKNPVPASNIHVLSISTGTHSQYIAGEEHDWGLVQWGPYLAQLFIAASGLHERQMLKGLIGDRHHRLDPILKKAYPIDDETLIDELVAVGMRTDLTPTVEWIRENWYSEEEKAKAKEAKKKAQDEKSGKAKEKKEKTEKEKKNVPEGLMDSADEQKDKVADEQAKAKHKGSKLHKVPVRKKKKHTKKDKKREEERKLGKSVRKKHKVKKTDDMQGMHHALSGEEAWYGSWGGAM